MGERSLEHAALMSIEDLREALLHGFAERRAEEIERGVTLVGPHREDITLLLGGMPVKHFASHGESWSFALALKLASWFVHVEDDSSVGSSPILILDDVFAELDSARRHRLGAMVAAAEQVLITCAVLTDIPEELGEYRLVSVTPGHAEYVPVPGARGGESEIPVQPPLRKAAKCKPRNLLSVRIMSSRPGEESTSLAAPFGDSLSRPSLTPDFRELDGTVSRETSISGGEVDSFGEFYRDEVDAPAALLTRMRVAAQERGEAPSMLSRRGRLCASSVPPCQELPLRSVASARRGGIPALWVGTAAPVKAPAIPSCSGVL